jgi:translation initiation factor 3 subunit E
MEQIKKYIDPHMSSLVFGTPIEKAVKVEKGATLEFANFLYQSKKYEEALAILKTLDSKWGQLACEIMLAKYQDAQHTIFQIKDLIELEVDQDQALEQRVWVLHWSLFVFFHSTKKDMLLDLYQSGPYLNCIQYKCPWILDYLAFAILCFKSRKSTRDFAKILSKDEFSSEIKDLILAIEDFKDISAQFLNVKENIQNDFFLKDCYDQFVDSIREYVLERFIKVGRVLKFVEFKGLFDTKEQLQKYLEVFTKVEVCADVFFH